MRLMFLCSGNICRSPMAAEYFRSRAARAGLSHVAVDSAGTLGIYDRGASPEAIEAMKEVGVDLGGHRSKGLEASGMRTADLVIVMSWDHREELAARYPDADVDRYLLRAFEKGPEPDADPLDLQDPIGRELEFYRTQRELIMACVDHLVLFIKHLP